MKILLLNENPVVTKLVTLSAQKTSDELEVVSSLEEIKSQEYDLLVVDDALYSEDLYGQLEEKIVFKHSLYICSRDALESDEFDNRLKKPFLPTDLVDLFATISQRAKSDENITQSEIDPQDEVELEQSSDLQSDESKSNADMEDMHELDLDDIELDFDEIELDSDELFGDDEKQEGQGESVLDNEEAQKVKELLDETSSDESDDEELLDDLELDSEELEDEDTLELDDLELDSEELEDDTLELDDEESEDENTSKLDDLELDSQELEESEAQESLDDLELESEESEDELELDLEGDNELFDEGDDAIDTEEPLEDIEDEDLQSQIEKAVEELSEEDLQSEIEDEALLESLSNEFDSLDSLSSRDLKLAVGEEVDDEPLEDEKSSEEVDEEPLDEGSIEESLETPQETQETQEGEEIEGVEALKNLLTALSDKKVAASLKGMKISINITMGGK